MASAEPPAAPRAETALERLAARLPDIVKLAGHEEMWGVGLSPSGHAPSQVVLHKFLRANNDDVAAAEKQLLEALAWRRTMQPAALLARAFDGRRFGDMGFVTVHADDAGQETVMTWNIYGSVKDNKATFGNVQEFIEWRVALMELGVQKLRLNDISEPLPDGGPDPYRMLQVHDYQSVSFFRMDPEVKAASRETIRTMSMAYPELLAHKYFVNVPAIMGWVFAAMKLLLAPATLRKFHPLASGATLATELAAIAATLPREYGGQGASVREGLTVRLTEGAAADEAAEACGPSTGPEEPTAAGEAVKGDEAAGEAKPAEAHKQAAP